MQTNIVMVLKVGLKLSSKPLHGPNDRRVSLGLLGPSAMRRLRDLCASRVAHDHASARDGAAGELIGDDDAAAHRGSRDHERLRAQVERLTAEVEAARTACARWAKVDSSAATVRLVLAAMDGAKP